MEAILIPLALLGMFGGILNLPDYLGGGWLAGFLGTAPTGEIGHGTELLLQTLAGTLALAGLVIAYLRYGGKRRQERIEAVAGLEPEMVAFFRNGWRCDDLYRFLFIRPYEALARFFWERVDEAVIDDSLDRLAAFLGWSGEGLGLWTSGRVSVYIVSFAAGAALLLAYLAWSFLLQ